ncbi:DCN1-like protein 3 [Anneissia japonica]|uniref:DCN1-like protein 3 n=1 Tax=Anneissia japonica TaxID=1529436 RepID=UPI0014259F59|nr:DCN1-like protein 3 [Anneissia japonica]
MGKCISCCGPSGSGNNGQNGNNGHTLDSVGRRSLTKTIPAPTIPKEPLDLHAWKGSVSNGQEKQKPSHIRTSNGIDTQPPLIPKVECSEARINHLFETYKDASEDSILSEGMEKFCQDLVVDPEDVIMLIIAWKFDASMMCRFTRKEFLSGFKLLKVDSIERLKQKFAELQQEVKDDSKFKDLYRYTFNFGLESDRGQRSLPIEIAIPLWELVFTNRVPPILDRWCNFLKQNDVRGISRDTWQMFLNFTEVIGADLSNYDDNEAWPSLFDDFVEYELERQQASSGGPNENNSADGNPLEYYL